jgi:GNAT superfamily N-acetyltransferase
MDRSVPLDSSSAAGRGDRISSSSTGEVAVGGIRRRRRYHRRVIESTAIEIRAAADGDAPRIAALLTDEGYPVGPTDVAARLAGFDGPESAVIVAEIDGSAIGFIAMHALPRFEHDDVVVRVLALVVDPAARERGVGRLLMAEAERFAADRSAAFVEVTAGHHRPDARRLYESMGYDAAATAYLRKRL